MRYLADVNVWLALAFERHPHCERAWEWLNKQEASSCIMCRMTQQGFLRLATNPKAFSKPLTHKQAWGAYDQFMGDERIEFEQEPPEIDNEWKTFTVRSKYSPKVWNDTYLAAFALKSRLKISTFDKGFLNYKGLSLELLQ